MAFVGGAGVRGLSGRRLWPGPGCARGAAESAGQDTHAVAGAGLGEDRLELVLDGQVGQRHPVRYFPGVAAGREQAEQFALAGGAAECPGEQVKAVGRGCLLDGHDEGRATVARRAGLFCGAERGCPQREPQAIGQVTGIEPREVDQGQHDGDRDTLAVSSAGMLVRRDVWEQVGGFDPGMALFGEDIDFCWRVHSAGYRVRVITDAICYHALAATRRKRAISVGRRARMLDRRNGLLTLLGNLPFSQMATAAVGNVVVSLLRIAFFLVGKRLTAAIDEAAAATSVLFHPIRLISMRSRRSRGRRAAYTRVKADLPPGRSLRRLAEFAAST